MSFPEDAACMNPCGEEPMGCSGCPERGNTGKPHDKSYYMDMYEFLEDNGWDPDYDDYPEGW